MPKPDMLPIEGEDGRGANCRRNIVVAINGTDLDTELLSLAGNIGKAKKYNVFVLYGIEVPRKLAIDAEMPEETAAGDRALRRARQVADQMHVEVETEIVQSRNLGQSLVDEARAHECSLVILGLPYHVGMGGHFDLNETADYVLKNAPCRVWLVRGQQSQSAESGESAAPRETVSTHR